DGEADRAGPDADGAAALVRLEDVGDDRQRLRHDGGAAEAHQGAGVDELVGALGVRRQQRGEREHRQPADQHPLAADAVADDAEGEQQPREHQRVGVDGPFELALRRAEALGRVRDGLQRDVEDGVVEHHHQQAHGQDGEDVPPAALDRGGVHADTRRSRLGIHSRGGSSAGGRDRGMAGLSESFPKWHDRFRLGTPPWRLKTGGSRMSASASPAQPAALYGGTGGRRVTVRDIAAAKQRNEKWPMLTAYDALTARVFDEVGIPVLLVGDSAAMVVYGHDSTIPVTVDDLIPLTAAVVRGTERAMVVADLPFGSYQTDV